MEGGRKEIEERKQWKVGVVERAREKREGGRWDKGERGNGRREGRAEGAAEELSHDQSQQSCLPLDPEAVPSADYNDYSLESQT